MTDEKVVVFYRNPDGTVTGHLSIQKKITSSGFNEAIGAAKKEWGDIPHDTMCECWTCQYYWSFNRAAKKVNKLREQLNRFVCKKCGEMLSTSREIGKGIHRYCPVEMLRSLGQLRVFRNYRNK